MSWIFPSFDDFLGRALENSPPRLRVPIPDEIKDPSCSVWCDEYEPQNKEDLAVNPKKVEEVETWLNDALNGRFGRAPIALLSGPSGSGKTATLKVLSKHMSFSIKEWITPPKAVHFREDYDGSGKIWYESQVTQFEEYLFRASRYSSVVFPPDLEKCIVLVEDIPNVYIHDTNTLEKTLRKYTEFGCCPIIFICNTGSPDFNLERMIFKEKLLNDLKITKFSFNPVGKRLLNSALKRVIQEGKKKNIRLFRRVPDDLIDQAIEMSNWDIRSAINHLQYILSGRLVNLLSYEYIAVMRKKKEDSTIQAAHPVGRDEFHDVFRCLGRVLYCKKVNVTDEGTGVVKQRLFYDPDDIVGSVSSVPNLFLSLLNENYVSIFTDMKKIAEATDYMTYTNILQSKLRDNGTDINFTLYYAVLGIMRCSNVGIKKKWLPFRSSKIKQAMASYEEKKEKCMALFPERLGNRNALMTEFLPYYAKMDMSKLDEAQRKFVRSFSDWKSISFTASPADVEDDIAQDFILSQMPSSSSFSGRPSLAKNESSKAEEVQSLGHSSVRLTDIAENEEEEEVAIPTIPSTPFSTGIEKNVTDSTASVIEDDEAVIEEYDSDD